MQHEALSTVAKRAVPHSHKCTTYVESISELLHKRHSKFQKITVDSVLNVGVDLSQITENSL